MRLHASRVQTTQKACTNNSSVHAFVSIYLFGQVTEHEPLHANRLIQQKRHVKGIFPYMPKAKIQAQRHVKCLLSYPIGPIMVGNSCSWILSQRHLALATPLGACPLRVLVETLQCCSATVVLSAVPIIFTVGKTAHAFPTGSVKGGVHCQYVYTFSTLICELLYLGSPVTSLSNQGAGT